MFLDLAVKGIEIFFHFLLDIRRELPGKIFQSISAFIGQPIVRERLDWEDISTRSASTSSEISLLELEIIGVLPVQDKIGNLRVGKISLQNSAACIR